MVEVKGIEKSFDSVKVLKGISSVFESGKINCIIGKSGSGKTVLLKTIIGLENPEKGQVFYDNREFTGKSTKFKKQIRREIGMVFQGGALFDSLTLIQNIIFPLEMFTNMPYKDKLERAHYCLNRVGLKNVDKKFPAELSGGMQKRASIARAIVNKPKYLFCDEPNSGLDPITSGKIDDLIKDISEEFKTTTIVNTHDMNSVFNISDKVTFISDGIKIWEGEPTIIPDLDIPELKNFMRTFLTVQSKKTKKVTRNNNSK